MVIHNYQSVNNIAKLRSKVYSFESMNYLYGIRIPQNLLFVKKFDKQLACISLQIMIYKKYLHGFISVSYTHLTLPTILRV